MWERGLKFDKHSTKIKKCVDEEQKREPEQNYPRRNREPEQNYPRRNREPEQNYPRRNREPEQNYLRPVHLTRKDKFIKPPNLINNNDEFPGLNEIKEKTDEPTNFYAEMCKKTSEEDIQRKNADFQPGCIGFKYDKKTHETTYTRDGIEYYPMEKYREECKVDEEKRSMERFQHSLKELERRYEEESQLHYELYGELDGYAIAKIERVEYEEYAKQFEIDETEEQQNHSDYEEDYYDSDMSTEN